MGRAERVEKGLVNNFGQNNCFLNVVIQSLWHLAPFREKFSTWETHTHDEAGITEEKCVHCSLKVYLLISCYKLILKMNTANHDTLRKLRFSLHTSNFTTSNITQSF